jgi:hypothetical protein
MERRSLLRPLALAVLVFGAVWCAMILRWRMVNRVPNDVDVVLYLVALPLVLLLGFALLRRGIDAARRRKRKAAAPEAGADDAAAAAPEDPSLAWHVPILAADALLAGGDSPAALAETARAGQRAGLHPTLRDGRGLPVFAVAVEGLDPEVLDETLPDAAQAWNDARKRALALAQTLATRLLEEHFEILAAASAPADPPRGRTPAPVLRLEWLLPAHWSDTERRIAQAWLAARLAAQGWTTPQLEVEARAAANGAAALKRLDDLNRAFHGDAPPLPHLLLASDSHIDEATVSEWDAAHRLHGARRPEGQVPGEGAGAVLLAAVAPANVPELARLHRLFAAQRAQPVDKPGRLQADTLHELAGQALAQAKLEADAPAHLVSDTDMRASRSAEALHLVGQAWPERDPADALLPLGMANGECGAALALAAVAVAARLAADTQQPGLVLSHHDASLRAVAVVAPPPADAPAGSTPSLA